MGLFGGGSPATQVVEDVGPPPQVDAEDQTLLTSRPKPPARNPFTEAELSSIGLRPHRGAAIDATGNTLSVPEIDAKLLELARERAVGGVPGSAAAQRELAAQVESELAQDKQAAGRRRLSTVLTSPTGQLVSAENVGKPKLGS